MVDGLVAAGGKFDAIGMSFYPGSGNLTAQVAACAANLADMNARYGRPVMLCEVGYAEKDPDTAKAFLTAILAAVAQAPGGQGVFYWEPESPPRSGYALGAWNDDGTASPALDAFAGR